MGTNIDIQGTPISRLPRETSPAGVDVSGVKSGRTVKVSLDLLATKDDVNNIDNNRKGYFSTDAELKSTYPNPKTGWYAYVGSTGTIWKALGGVWVDTGEPIPSDVDLSLYAKKTDLTPLEMDNWISFIKSIFKNKATLISQVFNGAYYNAETNTTTIPAGSTGQNTTFEATASKVDNRRVWLAFMVQITGAPLKDFSIQKLPSESVINSYQISDDTVLLLSYLDGNIGTRAFEVFLQKSKNAVYANDVKLLCIDAWTWNEPIGNNLSQDFQIDLLKGLFGIDNINNSIKSLQETDKGFSLGDSTLLSPRMQLFNGAIREGDTLIIPAGSTGQNTTFEFPKPSSADKKIFLAVRVRSTGAPLSDFYITGIPSNAVRNIIKIDDYESIITQDLEGVGTREFDLFLQKTSNIIYTQDVTLNVLECVYREAPLGNYVYNSFLDSVIKSLANKEALSVVATNGYIYKAEMAIVDAGGEVFNGASKITGGFRVTAGNTGRSSYIAQSVDILSGIDGMIEFVLSIGTELLYSNFDIRLNLQAVSKSFVNLGDGSYKVTIPLNRDANTVKLTAQLISGSAVSMDTDITIKDVFYYSYNSKDGKTASQILVDNKIDKNKPETDVFTVTTITCASEGSADFVGVNCIQDAIDSITDATKNKRYRVYIRNGNYFATNSSQYKGYPGYPSMICMKDWVEIEGESQDGVVIHAELPLDDSDIDTQYTRVQHQTMYNWAEWGNVRNLTLVGKNIRYTIHMDNGNARNKTRTYENVTVIFEGTKGYLRCFGLGTVTGETNILKNVTLISSAATFSCHNNTKFSEPAKYFIDSCSFYSHGTESFYIQNNGALKDCEFNFTGCSLPNTIRYDELWLKANPANKEDSFNHAETKVTGGGNSPCLFDNVVFGTSLCVRSKQSGGSVLFDSGSTAFDFLIKDRNAVIGAPVKSLRSYYITDGYYVLESSDGVNALAFGCVDLSELAATYDNGINYRSMGKRLGDCSTSSKTLTVIVDGTSYDIVFNKNYTNISNADIITEILSVIGTVADVYFYNFGREYYLEFKDCVQTFRNGEASMIPKGSIVQIKGDNVFLANSWDNTGVALDDIPVVSNKICSTYGSGRVLIKGILPHNYSTFSHYIRTSAIPQRGDKLSVVNGIATIDANGEKEVYESGLILI